MGVVRCGLEIGCWICWVLWFEGDRCNFSCDWVFFFELWIYDGDVFDGVCFRCGLLGVRCLGIVCGGCFGYVDNIVRKYLFWLCYDCRVGF